MRKHLLRLGLVLVVGACLAIILTFANRFFPRYAGHSARFWLTQVSIPNYFIIGTDYNNAPFDAFKEMGPKADSALISGFRAKEGAFHQLFAHLRWSQRGRSFCAKLPLKAQRVIDKYATNDAQFLPWAAQAVVQQNDLVEIVPKLLPLLKEPNWTERAAILGAVLYRIDPDKVTDAGLHSLSIVAQDEMPQIRLRAALCLAQVGLRATNELPTIVKLCADTNVNVRLAAAWALECIGGVDVSGTTLEKALSQWAESQGTPIMGWELSFEGPSFTINEATDSITRECLTNANPNVRRNACTALARHFEGARAARNILPKLMDDPDPVVRRKARSLIESISQSGQRSPRG